MIGNVAGAPGAIDPQPGRHVLQQGQRLRTLVRLHFGVLGFALQRRQPQQADRDHDQRNQDFDEPNARFTM